MAVCLPLNPRFMVSNLVEDNGFLKAIKIRSIFPLVKVTREFWWMNQD
jgi:hypothetical protein